MVRCNAATDTQAEGTIRHHRRALKNDYRTDRVMPVINGLCQRGGFLVGQVMKITKGRANPELVNQIIEEQLKRLKAGS